MRGIFCGTTARTNEEYKEQVKRKMKYMLIMTVIGLITLAVGCYAHLFLDTGIPDRMLGFYTGVGSGLAIAGAILFFRLRMTLRSEEKLKESRLSATDERLTAISDKAMRTATFIMLFGLYAVMLIGGLFIHEIIFILCGIVTLFVVSYFVAYRIYCKKM